jgi:hypothetical protein
MGIDGSEIKRQRIEREKRIASLNAVDPSPDPDQLTTRGNFTIKNLRPYVFGVVVPVLLVMIIIQYNYSHDTPPSRSTWNGPESTVSNAAEFNYADYVAAILNSKVGDVCKVSVSGYLTKTLKIDWTSKTTTLESIMILGQIGKIKEKLYQNNVRYFQYPNDSGTYNVIDWKTGEKTSIHERTPFYILRK